jgi:hypothetical protein
MERIMRSLRGKPMAEKPELSTAFQWSGAARGC